ncbi:RHS repeat domain-containing protein [Candidatus Scalindua japonica]|nr:RHS repeat-associated core domain-containing protein [Candidatus Scalindua japonica]
MDGTKAIALVETKIKQNSNTISSPVSLIRYQFADHLGSSRVELDQNGTKISYEEYYPFGGTTYHSFKNGTGFVPKRYRYSGKERDDESGFYYYGKRYYVPWLGRWLSPDPGLNQDGLNLYQFIGNNPLNQIDPDGQFAYATSAAKANVVKDALQRDVVKRQGEMFIEPHFDYVKVPGRLWGENTEKKLVGYRIRIRLSDVPFESNGENGSRTAAEFLDLSLNDPRTRIVVFPESEAWKPRAEDWDDKMNPIKWTTDICASGCGEVLPGHSTIPPAVIVEPDPKRFKEFPLPEVPWDAERQEYGLPKDGDEGKVENVQGLVFLHEIVGHAYGMSLDSEMELREQDFAILVEDTARQELGLLQRRPEKPKGYNNGVGLEDLRKHSRDVKLEKDLHKRFPVGRSQIEKKYRPDLYGQPTDYTKLKKKE